MNEYKQWHDQDNSRFNIESKINFSQCNKNKILSIHELYKMTSDIAVEDFNGRGLSREEMMKHNFMILLSRTSFRIHKAPAENQKILVQTWEEKNEPLQFIRAFEISDAETKEKLISGITTWLLVDSVARRLLPIKRFNLRPEVSTVTEHDCFKAEKIPEPENMTLIGERKIYFSDMDANGHTNNSRYGAFIEDFLPAEYAEKNFTDVKINFSKEAVLGETVKLYAAFDDENKKITVIGKTDGTSFEAELYW